MAAPAATVADLSTSQLRHLLLTKLHPQRGVEAWGANHATLLEIAADNGIHRLSSSDLEEVGPADRPAARKHERRIANDFARARATRRTGAGAPSRSLSSQLVMLIIVVVLQGRRLLYSPGGTAIVEWLGYAPPPCPPRPWWGRFLPFRSKRGVDAKGGACTPTPRRRSKHGQK